jgi:hypothetical protein
LADHFLSFFPSSEVLQMNEFALKVLNAPNFITGDNQLSRAGAFLFAFSFMHALPNLLLLPLPLQSSKEEVSSVPNAGLAAYQLYADRARHMILLPIFEIYLALSFLVHIWFAGKAALTKTPGWLQVSGLVMLAFLIKHLLDFRLGNMDALQTLLPEVLRADKLIYGVGVGASCIHVYMSLRPAWLFNLGFRGAEIPRLLLLGRVLYVVSAAAYLIPLLVKL